MPWEPPSTQKARVGHRSSSVGHQPPQATGAQAHTCPHVPTCAHMCTFKPRKSDSNAIPVTKIAPWSERIHSEHTLLSQTRVCLFSALFT